MLLMEGTWSKSGSVPKITEMATFYQ